MLDERPVSVVDELDPVGRTLTQEGINDLIHEKVDYLIVDNLFQECLDVLLASRKEAETVASQEGVMKEAGFGRRGTDYT
jgi:hypothetical protein